MKNHETLNKLISSLKEAKLAMRETADTSVSEELDKAIAEIELLKDSKDNEKVVLLKALECLHLFLKALPSLAALAVTVLSG